MIKTNRTIQSTFSNQRGVSTLVITMLMLVIISLVVLFSTGVGFFEQRTASNENRARIAEQAAEVGINMAGEYIKANRDFVIAKTTDGWLAGTSSATGWESCDGAEATATTSLGTFPHPCMAETNPDLRKEMWFYTTDGTGTNPGTTLIPYGSVGPVGGAAAFPSTVQVQALLCRIDTSLPTPACVQNPGAGNRIAVTFISRAALGDENSSAVIKETWASFNTSAFSSAVPLVASGIVKGLGNSQIVTSPNAGGYGVAASMWSPNNIGFGTKNDNGTCAASSGLGSSSTCHIEDYVFGESVEPSNVKTGCAGNKCGCPNSAGRYLSGHVAGDKAEGIDILDVDKIVGDPDYSEGFGPLPDIAFYPGTSCDLTLGVDGDGQLDDPADGTDDSLFEFIFNVDVVPEGVATTKETASVLQTCTPTADCAVNALLEDLDAKSVLCEELNDPLKVKNFNDGLYYVTDPTGCIIKREIGSATQSVVVVVEQDVDVKANFFGLLFVRSKDNTADVHITGGNKIFGAMAVEGDIDVTGTIHIVYDDISINSDPFKFPKNAKFARVPGSWLDATEGF